MARNQSFDDRDTTSLRYQGFWFLEGTYNASSVGQSGTLASSSDPNANVTFVFPTPAVAFYYYGIMRSRGGLYGVCIDCDPNNRQFIDIDAVNATDDGRNPPVVLFSRRFSEAGVHEIIIRNQEDPRFSGNSQITLDRIDIELPDPNPGRTTTTSSTSQTTTPPAPTNPTGASTGTSRPPSSTGTATNPTNTATRDSGTPVGAIVGISLAGVVILFGFIVGVLFWRRRQRAKDEREALEDPSSRFGPSPMTPAYPGDTASQYNPVVTPYSFSRSQSQTLTSSDRAMSPTGSSSVSNGGLTNIGAAALGVEPRGPEKGRRVMNAWPSVSTMEEVTGNNTSLPYAASHISSSSSGSRRNLVPSRRPQRELDGGPLPVATEDDEDDDALTTLPPEYGDVFPTGRRASSRRVTHQSNSASIPPPVPTLHGSHSSTSVRGGRSLPLPPNSPGNTSDGATDLSSPGVPDLNRTTYGGPDSDVQGQRQAYRSSIAKS